MRATPTNNLEQGLVDLASPVPVFVQVEQDIRRQILSGALRSGSRLPRETELARLYGISRMTVRHALEGLAEANLIRREHGVGTIVLPPPSPLGFDLGLLVSFSDQMRRLGIDARTVEDLRTTIEAPEHIREPLGLAPGERTVVIRRVRIAENRPLAVSTSWLPERLFPGLEQLGLEGGSLWGTLAAHYGVAIVRTDNTVELVKASASEAHLLHVETDAALLRFTGKVFDTANRPIEYTTTLWAGQVRFHFSSLQAHEESGRADSSRNGGAPAID